MDNKAQGSMFLYLLIFLFLIFFVFSNQAVQLAMINFGQAVFYPIIGFGGQYPVLTIVFAGLLVVILSGLLTNFFTDWKKMGASQEVTRAFQQEIQKARREGNTNRINKLMKMQPEIMKKQQEASSGSMKPMLFLIIFIYPIFMWLRFFLVGLPHYYFTTPWANEVSFFSWPFGFGQAWIWLYIIFSFVIGHIIRQALKLISWSNWWKNIRAKIRPSKVQM
ncbi:MAG: DUF106 domain-containing protein [Thermoplasmatales archaeon]|nr:MAG: DUF106 domain-containing protein [Thermoplasmatales archaeon]